MVWVAHKELASTSPSPLEHRHAWEIYLRVISRCESSNYTHPKHIYAYDYTIGPHGFLVWERIFNVFLCAKNWIKLVSKLGYRNRMVKGKKNVNKIQESLDSNKSPKWKVNINLWNKMQSYAWDLPVEVTLIQAWAQDSLRILGSLFIPCLPPHDSSFQQSLFFELKSPPSCIVRIQSRNQNGALEASSKLKVHASFTTKA